MESFNDLVNFVNWFDRPSPKPGVIAGPCAAESRAQVMETAKALSSISYVVAFRAGIWKPRTRPGSFEGVGTKGLPWLSEVKKETGLPVVVEIASPDHLKKALNYNIDMVWLGARTTSNPFSVQQIAEALKGTDLPVLVKNPVHPDLELWTGALERLYQSGIRKLAAVHRGFYTEETSTYRNLPHWEIFGELKKRFEQLPVLVDPSHIAGDSRYVEELTQKALDLDADGLMIETHTHPSKAWSDPSQQLTPDELNQMLRQLMEKGSGTDCNTHGKNMANLREQIDQLDRRMLHILSQRMQMARDIGELKKKNQDAVLQTDRWKEVLKSRMSLGKKMGLDGRFIQRLLELIHSESRRQQTGTRDQGPQEKNGD
jgi:chorismate mutase